MAVENASLPGELDESLPQGADFVDEGDNHLRLLKTILKTTFGVVTGIATQVEAEAQSNPSGGKLLTVQRGYQQTTARIADQATAEGETNNVKLMTSLRVSQLISNRLATQALAEAGLDNLKLMTSLRTAQAIAKGFTDRFAGQSTAIAGTSSNTVMSPLRSRQHGDARYLRLGQTTSVTRTLLEQATESAARGAISAAYAGIVISAGGGLSGGGTLQGNRTISHANTSSQGSVNNSGNTVIQDITLDTYGHITNINSKTLVMPGTTVGSLDSYYYGKVVLLSGQSIGENATFSGSMFSASKSGTWRNMGATLTGSGDIINPSAPQRILAVRIS